MITRDVGVVIGDNSSAPLYTLAIPGHYMKSGHITVIPRWAIAITDPGPFTITMDLEGRFRDDDPWVIMETWTQASFTNPAPAAGLDITPNSSVWYDDQGGTDLLNVKAPLPQMRLTVTNSSLPFNVSTLEFIFG